jgi:predicted DNA-binding ribbon-helix-helix protein
VDNLHDAVADSYAVGMVRTTIVADEVILDQLREIARREHVPLASVIREGLEMRARLDRRRRFVGAVTSGPPTVIADEAADLAPQPAPWR